MLDLYLLHKAKKNWQYVLAGIAIGITLYTYALAYIIIPAFLLVWLIYMLYMKKINIKQIIILGIPIFILALPLMYMILLNNGVFSKTQFGIFTIPKLWEYRIGEVAISNIWKHGAESLQVMFLDKSSFYYFDLIFFAIGLAISVVNTVKSIRKKEFNINSVMTLIFFALLITNMMVEIGTTNKCNIIYIPILYFITIGIIELAKKSWVIGIVTIILLMVLFVSYEYKYYTDYSYYDKTIYQDIELPKITKILEEDEKIKNIDKYIFTQCHQQQYIYTLLEKKISPYEFNKNMNIEEFTANVNDVENIKITRLIAYNEYHFPRKTDVVYELDYENNQYVFVVDKNLTQIVEFIENKNYEKQELEYYYILKKGK